MNYCEMQMQSLILSYRGEPLFPRYCDHSSLMWEERGKEGNNLAPNGRTRDHKKELPVV